MIIDTEVLVVGAGPVGLALAIELGTRNVRVMSAERHSRGGMAPRAKTTNVRTRTHLRRWGIAERLAQASPLGIDYPNDVMFITSLAGYKLAEFKNAFNAAPARSPDYPEHAQWIPQYKLENVMLEHARTLPSVDMHFDMTFIDAEQDADRVISTLRDADGHTHTVTSRYLIGADGARSTVRGLIGAKMEGRYGLSRNYNIIFRAPGLALAHRHGPAVGYWQIGANGLSVVGPMDRGDIWFFMPTGLKEGEVISDEDAIERIKRATGIDLPYEILSADEWVASELLADHYRDGRIVLAGDACHLHPPFGGYGMNMGIGDGVDLGWKIAATLQGWGDPALVETYEIERRPVHKIVIEEAVANHAIIAAPNAFMAIADDTPEGEALRQKVGQEIAATKTREFHTLGTVLGLCYEDSPIIEGESGPSPVRDGMHYRPSARPGCLAPHAWLDDGRSIYDLFGQGFALVVADGTDDAEVTRAEHEARALDVPFNIVRPPGVPVADLYGANLTLVRPDQHVAWRGNRWTSALRRAVGKTEGDVA